MQAEPQDGRPGRSVLDAALAAARSLGGLGPLEPVILAYTPVVRTNPYQRLLYKVAWDQGVAPVPVPSIDSLPQLVTIAELGIPVVGHLHWTNPILKDATSPDEASAAVDSALANLDTLRTAGGKIVWSIHNVLPHDTRYEKAEVRLRQGLVARADRVHVMAGATLQAVAERYPVPGGKVLSVHHPVYTGAYPFYGSRAQARFDLGIDQDERVMALVGAIHPYKGLDQLREAFEELSAIPEPPRRLIVAGRPDRGGRSVEFLDWAARHPQVTLLERTLSDVEMSSVLTAADAVVVPYERSLNSGVLMLALTFERPVVATRIGTAIDLVDGAVGRTYRPDDPDGLRRAWREVEELEPAAVRSAIAPLLASHDPAVVSGRFISAIRALAATET